MENNNYLTNEQMDSFLEEIGGLENGFFPDRPKIQKAGFFAVGNGWYGIIKELIEKSIAAGWDKQICQVKEKFGGLRFYINSAPDEVHKLIREAENKSLEICEVCGNPGKQRNGGWIKTLCEEHDKNR
jgi:hypothetical protein